MPVAFFLFCEWPLDHSCTHDTWSEKIWFEFLFSLSHKSPCRVHAMNWYTNASNGKEMIEIILKQTGHMTKLQKNGYQILCGECDE